MSESLDALFARLEELFERVEEAPEPYRGDLFDLLDAVDDLHRSAVHRLAGLLGPERAAELADADPGVAWLFEAYGASVSPPAPAPTPVHITRKRR